MFDILILTIFSGFFNLNISIDIFPKPSVFSESFQITKSFKTTVASDKSSELLLSGLGDLWDEVKDTVIEPVTSSVTSSSEPAAAAEPLDSELQAEVESAGKQIQLYNDSPEYQGKVLEALAKDPEAGMSAAIESVNKEIQIEKLRNFMNDPNKSPEDVKKALLNFQKNSDAGLEGAVNEVIQNNKIEAFNDFITNPDNSVKDIQQVLDTMTKNPELGFDEAKQKLQNQKDLSELIKGPEDMGKIVDYMKDNPGDMSGAIESLKSSQELQQKIESDIVKSGEFFQKSPEEIQKILDVMQKNEGMDLDAAIKTVDKAEQKLQSDIDKMGEFISKNPEDFSKVLDAMQKNPEGGLTAAVNNVNAEKKITEFLSDPNNKNTFESFEDARAAFELLENNPDASVEEVVNTREKIKEFQEKNPDKEISADEINYLVNNPDTAVEAAAEGVKEQKAVERIREFLSDPANQNEETSRLLGAGEIQEKLMRNPDLSIENALTSTKKIEEFLSDPENRTPENIELLNDPELADRLVNNPGANIGDAVAATQKIKDFEAANPGEKLSEDEYNYLMENPESSAGDAVEGVKLQKAFDKIEEFKKENPDSDFNAGTETQDLLKKLVENPNIPVGDALTTVKKEQAATAKIEEFKKSNPDVKLDYMGAGQAELFNQLVNSNQSVADAWESVKDTRGYDWGSYTSSLGGSPKATSTGPIDLGTALANLARAFNSLRALVIGVSFLLGIAFIIKGLMALKAYGSQAFGSAQRGELSGGLTYLVVGTVLCALGSTLDVSTMTLFGSNERLLLENAKSTITSYEPPVAPEHWKEIAKVLQLYAYLAGLIAFLRGLVIMSKMGQPGAQPGSFGKGITHVIGGTLLMHFIPFMQILAQTLGFKG